MIARSAGGRRLHVVLLQLPRSGPTRIYLEDLFVRPDWRPPRIGRALMVELARIADAAAGEIEWSVLNWNEAGAQDLRRDWRQGDRPTGTLERLTGAALPRGSPELSNRSSADRIAPAPGDPANGSRTNAGRRRGCSATACRVTTSPNSARSRSRVRAAPETAAPSGVPFDRQQGLETCVDPRSTSSPTAAAFRNRDCGPAMSTGSVSMMRRHTDVSAVRGAGRSRSRGMRGGRRDWNRGRSQPGWNYSIQRVLITDPTRAPV